MTAVEKQFTQILLLNNTDWNLIVRVKCAFHNKHTHNQFLMYETRYNKEKQQIILNYI